MKNSLLHIVWTEMCLGRVCTQPPYNDTKIILINILINKDIKLIIFKILINHWPIWKINPFSGSWLCDSTQAKAPPTIVDWHCLLTLDPPWVSSQQSAIVWRQSRSRQEWLLSDWGVLLLDEIMNIAVVIYSLHLSRWGNALPDLPKCVCFHKSFVIQLHLQKKWV